MCYELSRRTMTYLQEHNNNNNNNNNNKINTNLIVQKKKTITMASRSILQI